MGSDGKRERWLDTAVSGIRFGPDQRAVRAELEGHLEDKTADLRRIFPDIPEEEARTRALGSMGDPEELKISLARVHRPWLGYLWRASQVLLAVLLLMAVWNQAGIRGAFSDGYVSNYLEWREAYGERFPDGLEGPAPEWGEVLAVGAGAEPVTVGDYTFSVQRASFLRTDGRDGDCCWLVFTLRGEGSVPWALPGEDLGRWVQVTDSEGRIYRGRENPDREGRSQVDCGWSEHGLLWREYEGTVFLYLPGEGTTVERPSAAEGFQVEFDNGTARFSIPVVWTEVAP